MQKLNKIQTFQSQKHQVDDFYHSHSLTGVTMFELPIGFSLRFEFFHVEYEKTFYVDLYTQKNALRIFKTLNAAYAFVNEYMYEVQEDGKTYRLNSYIKIDVPETCTEFDEYGVVTGDVRSMDVQDLEITVKTYNCLKDIGIKTVGELLRYSKTDLLKTLKIGKISIEEICSALKSRGLFLSTSDRKVAVS
jgi:hypothetical protein